MRIAAPELSAVTDTTVTVAFAARTDEAVDPEPGTATPLGSDDAAAGQSVDVVLQPVDGGSRRVVPVETDERGLAIIRIDDLDPSTSYDIDLATPDVSADHDELYFPATFRTLATPPGELLATFATVSDLHFGEEVCGLGPSGGEGPVFQAADEDPPYWAYVNAAIVDEINKAAVEVVLVKGDITGDGHTEEFEIARAAFERLDAPWHAILGNHDCMQPDVDGLAVLGQPEGPTRSVTIDGCRLVLVDTVQPGKDGGVLPEDRRDALAAELDVPGAAGQPALVFAHHYTSTPRRRRQKAFGIHRGDSGELIDLLAERPFVGGWFAGHTHRNRRRMFEQTGPMPYVEVSATKDYPAVWGHYRVHEGGYLQEVRRVQAPKALAWAFRTKDMYWGLYRSYAFGHLGDRCFTYRWSDRDANPA